MTRWWTTQRRVCVCFILIWMIDLWCPIFSSQTRIFFHNIRHLFSLSLLLSEACIWHARTNVTCSSASWEGQMRWYSIIFIPKHFVDFDSIQPFDSSAKTTEVFSSNLFAKIEEEKTISTINVWFNYVSFIPWHFVFIFVVVFIIRWNFYTQSALICLVFFFVKYNWNKRHFTRINICLIDCSPNILTNQNKTSERWK